MKMIDVIVTIIIIVVVVILFVMPWIFGIVEDHYYEKFNDNDDFFNDDD